MSSRLPHLTSIHDAAQELHKLFLGAPWYLRCQVYSHPPERLAATNKQERREIVVYVSDMNAANGMTTFHSWPIRYEQGA